MISAGVGLRYVVLVGVLTACRDPGQSHEPHSQPTESAIELNLGSEHSFALRAVDTSGAPLADAWVRVGTASARTDTFGNAVLYGVPVGPALAHVGASGHADQVRDIVITEDQTSLRLESTLVPLTVTEGLVATEDGHIVSEDGAFDLLIPAGSLVTLDESPWEGSYTVAWASFDSHAGVPLPGPLMAEPEGGNEDALETYGSFQVAAETPEGEPLQLAEGATATVSMAVSVPPDQATVPMWTLDPTTGRWVDAGVSAALDSAGDRLTVAIPHFSPPWNFDLRGARHCARFSVSGLTDAERGGAELEVTAPGFTARRTVTAGELVEVIGLPSSGLPRPLTFDGDSHPFRATLYLYDQRVDARTYRTAAMSGEGCRTGTVTPLRLDASAITVHNPGEAEGDREMIVRLRDGDCPAGSVTLRVRDAAGRNVYQGSASTTAWIRGLHAKVYRVSAMSAGRELDAVTVDCTSGCGTTPALVTLEVPGLALDPVGACVPLPCEGPECDSCVWVGGTDGPVSIDGVEQTTDSSGSVCADEPDRADQRVQVALSGGWQPSVATLPRGASCATGGCAEVRLSDGTSCTQGSTESVSVARRARLDPATVTSAAAPWPVNASRLALRASGDRDDTAVGKLLDALDGNFDRRDTLWAFLDAGDGFVLRAPSANGGGLEIRLGSVRVGSRTITEGLSARVTADDDGIMDDGYFFEFQAVSGAVRVSELSGTTLAGRLDLSLCYAPDLQGETCPAPVRLVGMFAAPLYTQARTPTQLAYVETTAAEGRLVEGAGTLYGSSNAEGVVTVCAGDTVGLVAPARADELPGIAPEGARSLYLWERRAIEQLYATLGRPNQGLDRVVTVIGEGHAVSTNLGAGYAAIPLTDQLVEGPGDYFVILGIPAATAFTLTVDGVSVNIPATSGGVVDRLSATRPWYVDADGDGYGDADNVVLREPGADTTGLSADATDCEDDDAAVNPGAAEICDAEDQDCDGRADEGVELSWHPDLDGDGFGDGAVVALACAGDARERALVDDTTDCDDADAGASPVGIETCDGADEDCDGVVDDGVIGAPRWFADADGDGFGDAARTVEACAAPAGFVADAEDCDDTSGDVSPAAIERCDGIDDDCDGVVDDGAVDATIWFVDADGDGHGDAGRTQAACTAPAGFVADDLDCDDTSASVGPSAAESCDGLDENCDGVADDGLPLLAWYADADGDGWGDPASLLPSCGGAPGFVANELDCDDTSIDVSPHATERCDGVDEDCDGLVDDGAEPPTWYLDADGDGHGDPTAGISACEAPIDAVSAGGDCDDTDPARHPGAAEADCADPLDYNCDGSVGYTDADGDGVVACEECDDAEVGVHPGAAETCDGVDEDCDGVLDNDALDAGTWYGDLDADGFGDALNPRTDCGSPVDFVANELDCDDTSALVSPDSPETCNGADDDCDGAIDDGAPATSWYVDRDGDHYGDPSTYVLACIAPTGSVRDSSDCDDADPGVHPDVIETCDGVDQDCDGAVDDEVALDTWYDDGDGDGHGDADTARSACAAPAGTVALGDDCDDADDSVYPGASETDCADPVDRNCDGAVGLSDGDGDGYAACEECDDAQAAIHPGAAEICDGRDEDCDGIIDLGAIDAPIFYLDTDGDGFGDASAARAACTLPADSATAAGDCDDNAWAVHPGASETCDGIDQDCDGQTDEDASDRIMAYLDLDGDGHGDITAPVEVCALIPPYVGGADDCDDTRATVSPEAEERCDDRDNDCDGMIDEDAIDAPTWYVDADGDGYGDRADATACDAPPGTVAIAGDCDDADVSYNPGITEDCADPRDTNCDDAVGYLDGDADGFAACEECDDGDAAVNPAASERCNGVDDDCDGDVDGGAVDAPTFYADADRDGYGDASLPESACATPGGYVVEAGDCDDADTTAHPGALEACDGADDDCDGFLDNDAFDRVTSYIDADGDSFGDEEDAGTLACGVPSGRAERADDCDDADATVSPEAAERCNDRDDDCSGAVDDAAVDAPTWFADGDGDGYGAGEGLALCDPPPSWVSDNTDCEDWNSSVHPGALETCDGVDEDCSFVVDDEAVDAPIWFWDSDNDGYGDAGATVTECATPSGYVAIAEDCVDYDAAIFPGAPEVCNGSDDDCNGSADDGAIDGITWYADLDGDGWGDLANTAEACDQPSGYLLDPGDVIVGDCDDLDGSVNLGATESCNTIDDDCDGDVDEVGALGSSTFYADVDGDGYGDPENPIEACEGSVGVSADGSDCDDGDANAWPGAPESCDGRDSDCDGADALIDSWEGTLVGTDVDGFCDGYCERNITGDLVLSDQVDPWDLSCVVSVAGELRIHDNTVTSLSGLESLTTVGGDVMIDHNNLLTSLAGLDTLTTIDGSLYIGDNDILPDLSGLDALRTVGGHLYVDHSEALVSLDGLDAVTSVGGDLSLGQANTALTRLAGLDALVTVGGSLFITGHDTPIEEVSGFGALTSVGGGVYLHQTTTLESVTGLSHLQSIGTYLEVWDNAQLSDLSGLGALTSVGMLGYGGVLVTDNDTLTNLDLPALAVVSGSLEITDNPALLWVDLSGLTQIESGGLDIWDNGALVELDIGQLTNVDGDVEIANDSLADLRLGTLQSATSALIHHNRLAELDLGALLDAEYVFISDDPSLETIALQSLTEVGTLDISYNPSLTGVDLDELSSVYSSAIFLFNDTLTTLELPQLRSDLGTLGLGYMPGLTTLSMPLLTEIGGYFYVIDCPALDSLGGMGTPTPLAFQPTTYITLTNTGISHVDELAGLTEATGLFIQDNAALVELDGLAQLVTVSESLVVRDNHVLSDLGGLAGLSSVGYLTIESNSYVESLPFASLQTVTGSFRIIANPSLLDLYGMPTLSHIQHDLEVDGNDVLTDVSGLAGIGYIGGNLILTDNPSLPTQAANDLAAALDLAVGGTIVVSGNQ